MRDDGDRILAVFAGVLLVGAPFFDLLTPPVLLAMAAIGGWVLLMTQGRVDAPPQWLRVMFSFAIVALLVFSYGTIFGLIPGTVMILLLCMLKMFEIRSGRDINLIVFLCLFLTASNFFHSQSFWVAVYMFVVVLYLVSLLMFISDRTRSTAFRWRLEHAFRHILYALPFMLVLFVLFPRLPGPLWGLPDDEHSARTGITDELTPGSVSDLISSSEVAFRVSFDDEVPPRQQLYWRGLVLSEFDGATWRRNDAPFYTYPNVELTVHERGIYQYVVTLEPTREHWLYTLDTPVIYDNSYRMTRELQLYSKTNITGVTRYAVASSVLAIDRGLFDEEQAKNLALPAGLNPATQAFGVELRRQSDGDAARIVDSALAYFNEQAFYYTLKAPKLSGNTVDQFLFESRRGFCEHYSTSFATLMRAAGVPARVIVGYQGGEMHPQQNYMIIRQSDAHAWAEVWVKGRWWRVDPTASVSPDRIELGVQHAGLERDRLPMLFTTDSALLRDIYYQWDSLQNTWNQWVIGFDSNRQKQLFLNLGVDDVSAADLVAWLVAAMTLTGALVAGWVLLARRKRRDAVQQAYDSFCRKLARAGLVRSRYEGAREFEQRVLARKPKLTPVVRRITALYHALRYGEHYDAADLRQLRREVSRFRVN